MNEAAIQLGKLSAKKRFSGMNKAQIKRHMTILSEKAAKKRMEKAKEKE